MNVSELIPELSILLTPQANHTAPTYNVSGDKLSTELAVYGAGNYSLELLATGLSVSGIHKLFIRFISE